ncbi:RcnB family protein [Larsenimonas salina]|uniref:RcnB family protein n=1 Tax=Larsenimonas salina TaxID=1295565 RepID=UPI002072D7C4|nr:RcnB family protein [Larsenimonas salina]MCM5705710.1 RcnB family protein [Larsenimonas salina]
MKTLKLTALILGACIGASSVAMADEGHGDPKLRQDQQLHGQRDQHSSSSAHDQRGHSDTQAGPDRMNTQRPAQAKGHDQRGPDSWRQGERMPGQYRDDRHAVRDWHAHGLSKPPAGHRWYEVDGRYVLAAVASGIITSIILGH